MKKLIYLLIILLTSNLFADSIRYLNDKKIEQIDDVRFLGVKNGYVYYSNKKLISSTEKINCQFVSSIIINENINRIDCSIDTYGNIGCIDQNACNYNPNAGENDGSCDYPEENFDCDDNCIVDIDCAGECGGNAELDICGVCDGGIVDINKCTVECPKGYVVDCQGVCGGGAVVDECGVCGGNTPIDQCGICNGDNSSCADCAGVPNGDAQLDACGVCGGDNSSCADCAGVPNGDAVEDNCGTCDANSSNDCFSDKLIFEKNSTTNSGVSRKIKTTVIGEYLGILDKKAYMRVKNGNLKEFNCDDIVDIFDVDMKLIIWDCDESSFTPKTLTELDIKNIQSSPILGGILIGMGSALLYNTYHIMDCGDDCELKGFSQGAINNQLRNIEKFDKKQDKFAQTGYVLIAIGGLFVALGI